MYYRGASRVAQRVKHLPAMQVDLGAHLGGWEFGRAWTCLEGNIMRNLRQFHGKFGDTIVIL